MRHFPQERNPRQNSSRVHVSCTVPLITQLFRVLDVEDQRLAAPSPREPQHFEVIAFSHAVFVQPRFPLLVSTRTSQTTQDVSQDESQRQILNVRRFSWASSGTILNKIAMCRQILEKIRNVKFNQFLPVEVTMIFTEGQTDGRTWRSWESLFAVVCKSSQWV